MRPEPRNTDRSVRCRSESLSDRRPEPPHAELLTKTEPKAIPKLKLLYLIDESLEKNRSDINTLFQERLADLGIVPVILDLPFARQNGNFAKHWWMLRNVISLFRLCHCRQRDGGRPVIQVRNLLFYGLLALLIARARGVKFCYWLSFPVVEFSSVWTQKNKDAAGGFTILKKSLKRRIGAILLYRILLPRADHIFVQSEVMKRDISIKINRTKRISSVPMGIDEHLAEQVLTENQASGEDRHGDTLLYVGALDREREIEYVLHAFHQVAGKFENLVLKLIGSARSRRDLRYLKETVRQLGIEGRVLFLGNVDRLAVFQNILQATIGVSPIPPFDIYKCSSPTKIIEYLALGLPTVANDIADQKAMIELTRGGICVPHSVDAYADAIEHLLQDETYRARLMHSGREKILELRGYDSISRRVANDYKALVARDPGQLVPP